MPAPTPPDDPIPVPPPPDRTDRSTFVSRSFVFTNWYIPFQAWLETVVAYIIAAIDWVDSLAGSATASASTAAAAASSASASAASALQQPGTNATSTTSFTPVFGSNSFTLAQTGKNFVVGQFVTVADSVTPDTKYFNGAITAFNAGTGAITVNARDVFGSAVGNSWVITASAPSYGQKFTSPVQVFVAKGTTGGSVNADMRAGLWQTITTNANTTFTFTEPDIATSSTISWIVLDITKGGSHTLTFPVGTIWSDGAQPTHNSGSRFQYFGTKTGTGPWVFSAARKNIA